MRLISGKIPIRIHPLFLLLAIVIGWLNSQTVAGTLVWMGVVFFSVLIHELGHALTGLYFGQRVSIELHGLGGVTKRRGPSLKLWQEFLIVLNGPLAGFALFLVASKLYISLGQRPMDLLMYAVEITAYANLFWTILNLVPVLPLDGGQLLRILLEAIFGLKGIKFSFFISMLLSLSLGVFFFQYGAMLIGIVFFMLAFEGYRSWQGIKPVTKQDKDVNLQAAEKAAEKEMKVGDKSLALKQFMEIREKTRSGVIFTTATEHAAKILSDQEKYEEALDLLKQARKNLSIGGLRLWQEAAFQLGNWREVIAIGNESFQNFPTYETALLNALSHSMLKEAEPAMGWLQTAINEGLPNLNEVLKRKEFDFIRDDFQQDKI